MFTLLVTVLSATHDGHRSSYREHCVSSVSDTFNIWQKIEQECKDKLYRNDRRWHDHAMWAEQSDAERFCREGHREAILKDTYPADMAADIFDAIHSINKDTPHSTPIPEQGVASMDSIIC